MKMCDIQSHNYACGSTCFVDAKDKELSNLQQLYPQKERSWEKVKESLVN